VDVLLKGLSEDKGLRFIFADVTFAARELIFRHESGPLAGEVLAQALASAALLSADARNDGDCLCVQLSTDGPVRGVMAEASGAGTLRGYANVKSLDADRLPGAELAGIMGTSGVMNVVLSEPGKVLYSGQVEASPPDLRSATARYFNQSLQTPTGVALVSAAKAGQLSYCRALAAQRMPDGLTEAFVPILEAFNDGSVHAFLSGMAPDEDPWQALPMVDIETTATRKLSFGCRCSESKAVEAVSSLSAEEISEAIDTTGKHEVTCHMCGQFYEVGEQILLELLIRKAKQQ
jgi:molecular chaperone Hsp33